MRSIESVTRNDDMPTLVTRIPLIAPTAMQIAKPISKATPRSTPAFCASSITETGASAKTAPTERSNSPAVSSSVMPRAMMPSSGKNAIMLEMLSGDRNLLSPIAKAAKTTTRITSDENSGARSACDQRLGLAGGVSDTATIAASTIIKASAAVRAADALFSLLLVIEIEDRADAAGVIEAERVDVVADRLAGRRETQQGDGHEPLR